MKEIRKPSFTIHANKIAFLAFCLIYPLDAFFYVVSSDFNFPNVPVAIIGMILGLFILILFSYKQRIRLINIILCFAFTGLFFPIILSNHTSISEFWVVIRMISYVSIGYFFTKNMFENPDYNRFKHLNILIVFISIFVGLFFLKNLGSIDLKAVYLRPAHAIVITCLICFYYLRKIHKSLSYLFMFYTIIILVIINSRATVLGFCLSIAITGFASKKITKRFFYLSVFPIFLFILYFYSQYLYQQGYNGVGHRLIRLIGATDKDTSLEGRQYFWEYGKDYFYQGLRGLGHYKYYTTLGPGAYIHDARSYIAEFGIFGLLMLVTKIYVFAKYFFIYQASLKYNFRLSLIFSLIVYALFNMIFIQHFSYASTFLILGMALFAINYKQKVLTKNPITVITPKNNNT